MRLELVVVSLLVAPACSGDKGDAPPSQPPAIALVPSDGGVSSTVLVAPPGVDPSAVHLDDHGPAHRPSPEARMPARERRPIDVTLRSSPPGATVSVDGRAIGTTPAHWPGFADGREHEFVFTLPRHAMARYRFVPISSGVIHAQLEPILEERDAGVPALPPEVQPGPPPSAIVPPAPPPTIVRPADPPPTPVRAPAGSAAPVPAPTGSALPGPVAPGAGSPTPAPAPPAPSQEAPAVGPTP